MYILSNAFRVSTNRINKIYMALEFINIICSDGIISSGRNCARVMNIVRPSSVGTYILYSIITGPFYSAQSDGRGSSAKSENVTKV